MDIRTDHHSPLEMDHSLPGQSSTFSIAEQNAFHQDDIKTGKTVISLLTIIFFLGLLLYIAVLYFVMASPQIT